MRWSSKVLDGLILLAAVLTLLVFAGASWLEGAVMGSVLRTGLPGLSLIGWTLSRGYFIALIFLLLPLLQVSILAIAVIRLANVNLGRVSQRGGFGAALMVTFRVDGRDPDRNLARLGMFLSLLGLLLLVLLLLAESDAVQGGYWGAVALVLLHVLFFLGAMGAYSRLGNFLKTKPLQSTANSFFDAPNGSARIEVLSGPMQGRRESITKNSYTIGRRESNDLVLWDEMEVSRDAHATIVYRQGAYYLRARGPEQKVYAGPSEREMNREYSYRLNSGDYFKLGDSLIHFKIER